MVKPEPITTSEGIIYPDEPLYEWLKQIYKAIQEKRPAIIYDDYNYFLEKMMVFPHKKEGNSYIFTVCGAKIRVYSNPDDFPPRIDVEPLEWKWECREI